MKSVIFDLDGTLADTSRDLIASANVVLCKMGCGEPLDHRIDIITAFKGGRAMLREGFAKAGQSLDETWLAKQGYEFFLEVYETNLATHTALYPHVSSALDTLAEHGWGLGVCTNKPTRLARLLLKELGILQRFASLIGAGTLFHRKPHPEPLLRTITEAGGIPDRSILIGDTQTDLDTARAANVRVVLVEFGPQGEAVNELAPDAFLSSYQELPEIAERLVGIDHNQARICV